MSELCVLADDWLRAPADEPERPLPEQLVGHVASCPRCQVALIALLTDRMAPLADPTDRPCEQIELEIPAFVDAELDNGLASAARAYPDVWWHTLTCPDCDEIYRGVSGLARRRDRTRRGKGWPADAAAQITVQFEIHSVFIQQMRNVQLLGRRMGGAQEGMIIAEQQATIGRIQLALRIDSAHELAIVVSTEPPIAGTVTLTLGGQGFVQPIDERGQAVFPGFREDQLSGEGHQLTLRISPPQE